MNAENIGSIGVDQAHARTTHMCVYTYTHTCTHTTHEDALFPRPKDYEHYRLDCGTDSPTKRAVILTLDRAQRGEGLVQIDQ